MASRNIAERIYDVLGIGFGPANLSIAAAFAEQNLVKPTERRLRKVCFVEAQPEFRWHPGMMIPGSRMQISFLKDLATMRSPTSPFTFLNYLASQNRLVTFINRSTFTPTRREFADYLTWVAAQVVSRDTADCVLDDRYTTGVDVFYGQRVTGVEAVLDSDLSDVTLLRVWSTASDSSEGRQSEPTSRLCRNLIVSPGGKPALPPPFRAPDLCSHPRVMHTSQFLDRVDSVLDSVVASHLEAVALGNDARSVGRTSQPPSAFVRYRSGALPETNQGGPFPATRGDMFASVAAAPGRPAFAASTSVAPMRIAVMGGGQSAAETFMEIRSRLASLVSTSTSLAARPKVDLIIRKNNMHPSDDSPFSNEIFDPSSTDFFYNLGEDGIPVEKPVSEEGQVMGSLTASRGSVPNGRSTGKTRRQVVLAEAQSTNYAVVNPTTLETVYETMYAQRVEEDIHASSSEAKRAEALFEILHDPKLSIIRHTEVVQATPVGSGVELILSNVLTGDEQTVKYDAVILGTGYTRQGWRDILFGDATTSQSTPSRDGVMLREFFGCGPDLTAPASSQVSSTGSSVVADTDDSAISPPPTNAGSSAETLDSTPSHSKVASQAVQPSHDKPQLYELTSDPVGGAATGNATMAAKRGEAGLCSEVAGPFGVTRKYRLILPERAAGKYGGRWFRPKVWLQGSNEWSHGISDSLLSVLAVRSAEVVGDIESAGNL